MGASGGQRSAPDFAQQRSGRAGYHNRMRDPFNLFGSNQNTPRERQAKPLEAKALETLGLTRQGDGDRDKGALQGIGETPPS
jgi:hypothetical protein